MRTRSLISTCALLALTAAGCSSATTEGTESEAIAPVAEGETIAPATVLPDGDVALLFWNTSSTSGAPVADWDRWYGKATCATGQAIAGVSDMLSSGVAAAGRTALCRPNAALFTGQGTYKLTLDAHVSVQPTPSHTNDWAYGYYKLECNVGDYISAVSEYANLNADAGPNDDKFHAIECSHGSGLPADGACSVVPFDKGDARLTSASGDWDPGAFKGECGAQGYAAGISVATDTGAPHSLLCCPTSTANLARSKTGAQRTADAETATSFGTFNTTYCPRVAKWIAYPASGVGLDFNEMLAYKQQCPGGTTIARVWGPYICDPHIDPNKCVGVIPQRAGDGQGFWNQRYTYLDTLTDQQRALIDYVESDNEEDAGYDSLTANATEYGNFLSSWALVAATHGFRPLIGNFGVGGPVGDLSPSCMPTQANPNCAIQSMNDLLPAIRKANQLGGGWAYHAYSAPPSSSPTPCASPSSLANQWSTDAQNTQIWYSLRHRLYANSIPELTGYKLFFTEAGGYCGLRRKDSSGAIIEDDKAAFLNWMIWWDGQIANDSYVKGATVFTFSSNPQWSLFQLNTIATDFGNTIR